MKIEIITIGDELLIGQVVDTNSAWMAGELNKIGAEVYRVTTVGDNRTDILNAIDAAVKQVDVVLLTGGIGPTKDDITKNTLCEYFDTKLIFDQDVYEDLKLFFTVRGREPDKLSESQAYVPEKCTVIRNPVGTAPITWFEWDGKILVSMPGVPQEMKWMMTNEILPRLVDHFGRDLFILHKTFLVKGFGEAQLSLFISSWENQLPENIRLAYLPSLGFMRLRLSVHGKNREEAEHLLSVESEKLRTLLGEHIFSENDVHPAEIIGERLRKNGKTLGAAESCTGGYVSHLITLIPGSSDYFKGSVISYSNEIKQSILKVGEAALKDYGAVSKEVVEEMAKGALSSLNVDYSIATSGIAGPGGGTEEKPVGMVWIAAANKDSVIVRKYYFGLNREQNIIRAANTTLLMLLEIL
ncbi:MAG: competence/damage-inducible protein A [Candidatus Azobacteroides sp.]|nr:competence/damage-inducible protein A [Candidatus Azobacteroides sp.]